jgi:1-acyl-sn-glycerol-3-phosphate acyltransferase
MSLIASIDDFRADVDSMRGNGVIIIANHRSLLDLIVALIVFRRWKIFPYFFIREDLFLIPAAGWLLRSIGGIPVGPENGVRGMRQGIQLLRDGGVLVIMPEGKIPRIGAPADVVGRLKPGVAKLASANGSAVLVAGLANTDAAWPPGSVLPKFHFRKSHRPHISVTGEWILVEKGSRNTKVISALDDKLRSLLDDLSEHHKFQN